MLKQKSKENLEIAVSRKYYGIYQLMIAVLDTYFADFYNERADISPLIMLLIVLFTDLTSQQI